MKKVIALMITVAMVFTLAAVSAFADDGHYVWNHTGAADLDSPFGETFRIGNDCPNTGSVGFKTDVSFSKVIFPKIWATIHAVVTMEVFSGDNSVFTGSFELYNAALNSGDVADVEVDFGKTLPAGAYKFVFSVPDGLYAFFAYGAGQLPDGYITNERGHIMFGLWTTDSGNGFVDQGILPAEKTVSPYSGTADGNPVNLKDGSIAVVVTVPEDYVLAEVRGLASPTWSNQGDGSDAVADVYVWEGDYDSTVAGPVLLSKEVRDHRDNKDLVFAFDKKAPAGTYMIEFTSIGDMDIGFWSYSAIDGDAEVFQNGDEADFYPKVAVKLLLAEGQDVITIDPGDDTPVDPGDDTPVDPGDDTPGTPTTPVDTGDASVAVFAIIAVLALLATVVLKKKRFF
ncbi:MAG: hypothetical protein ILO53_00535 [Clostridia bacterium]|nr:hypothetical protein [Clostridia bacterium]